VQQTADGGVFVYGWSGEGMKERRKKYCAENPQPLADGGSSAARLSPGTESDTTLLLLLLLLLIQKLLLLQLLWSVLLHMLMRLMLLL
jgi:hypothetical protein